jgi:hypothetical protein
MNETFAQSTERDHDHAADEVWETLQ